VPHGDVQQEVGQLRDAIGPDIQDCLTRSAELFDEDFAPCDAPGFFEDIRIYLGKLVVALVAEWPAWAVRCVVAFAVERGLAAGPVSALIAACSQAA
jgi:hypothetical protein